MNNPFDYSPDKNCADAFRVLVERIESLKRSDKEENILFYHELSAGKMLGVLIAEDSSGKRHTLYAFSGQIGNQGFHFPGFVGPVFDYLQPNGYFKIKEREISGQNSEIHHFETSILSPIKSRYEREKETRHRLKEEYKEKYRQSKQERDNKRKAGAVDAIEQASMIRQSQFEKAEFHRLKKRLESELELYASELQAAEKRLKSMKDKRHAASEELQRWLFSNFRLLNARGETKTLDEIFRDTFIGVPPSGAGECCAPKLLQAAYLKEWTPIAMAEYWYGVSKNGELRIHGEHYPACHGKCLPILTWMLEGLNVQPPLNSETHCISIQDPEIIFENQWFCVVNKPSGMLSVPGKGKTISVQQWLADKYGPEVDVRMAHRLDQDTSGIIIAAFNTTVLKVLHSIFRQRQTKKSYVAIVEGDYRTQDLPPAGRISLPLSPDWFDRPRQRVDVETGKKAVTEYEFISVEDGRSRVLLHPLTGRTHQLRVHAASEAGLGMPITGDRLYGKNRSRKTPRLLLHAQKIEFTFPIDKQYYSFEVPEPF